jgi:hypothetical protein
MNTVTVVGNLTRDPELRYTPTGQVSHPSRHVECRGRISPLLTERGQPTSLCPTFSNRLSSFRPGARTLWFVSPRNTL